MPRLRFTIQRLMIAIAFMGVCLAASRVHLALGITSSCVSLLTLGRTFGVMDRLRMGNTALPVGERVDLLIGSLMIATTLLTCSFVAAVGTAFILTAIRTIFVHELHDPWPGPLSMICGLFAATWACSSLRRSLWPYRHPSFPAGETASRDVTSNTPTNQNE